MLTQIDVVSENAFTLPILGITPKAPLLIRSITGLNPPDINLFIGDYARDGGIYQGRRVGTRDVVFTIDLNPDPALGQTVSSLRNDLYKAFIDPQVEADYLKFVLHDDVIGQLYLYGYTDKFETDIFTTDRVVQISVLCPDPYIRDDEQTTVTNLSDLVTINFPYNGTAETGFEVEIFVTDSNAGIVLDNNSVTDDPLDSKYHRGRMLINHPFVPGDVVYVNTTRGSRQVLKTTTALMPAAWSASTTYSAGMVVSYNRKYWTALAANTNVEPVSGLTWVEQDMMTRWQLLKRNGATSSLLGDLDSKSRWIELHSQNNRLRVYGDTPDDVVAAIRTLAFTQAYWGV